MARCTRGAAFLLALGAFGCGSGDDGGGGATPKPGAGSSKVAEITLDPVSGAVDAAIDLRIEDPPKELVLAFDVGLAVESATADGAPIEFSQTEFSPFNLVTLPIAEPESVFEARFVVQGTLACDKLGESEDYTHKARLCYRGTDQMALIKEGAIVPLEIQVGAEAIRTFRYDVTLHTPNSTSIVATGEAEPPIPNGDWTTTRWRLDQPVPSGFTIIAGTFDTVVFDGVEPKVQLLHSTGETDWNDRLDTWLPEVVPFVEAFAGRPLPFELVSLVKLSPALGDAGYNAQNMILLSDMHAGWGDALFEESWAHEFAHLFWCETVTPRDATRTAVLSEGMAVLAQKDYGFAKHHATEDRDEYLGRRSREPELLARYVVPAVPPLVTASASETMPQGDVAGFWLWAYQKAAATLDYLRLTVGEPAFMDAIALYTQRCQHARCTFDDFIDTIETRTDQDLGKFVEQFFRQVNYPAVSIAFTQTELASGKWSVSVTLTQPKQLSVPIELWLEQPSSPPRRERVVLEGNSDTWTFELDEPVRSIRPNPRQEAVLFSYSAVAGDIDYDGVNGESDRAACGALLGRYVDAPFVALGEAVSGVDLDFNWRCDADGDAAITEMDLALLFP